MDQPPSAGGQPQGRQPQQAIYDIRNGGHYGKDDLRTRARSLDDPMNGIDGLRLTRRNSRSQRGCTCNRRALLNERLTGL